MRSMVEGPVALRKNQHNYSAARRQRREMSLPEGLLWRELRRSPMDVKFRRQHPVGPYVIDFYCAQAKTGFEIDGIVHDMDNRPERDKRRIAWSEGQGLKNCSYSGDRSAEKPSACS